MVNAQESLKQLLLTSILGLFSKLISIFISGLLDKSINHSLSNFIGLIINAFLDFFMLKYVFNVSGKKSDQFVIKYIISVLIAIGAAQLLYDLTHSFVRKEYPEWSEKNWDKHVFLIRYIVGAITYAFIEFPLHKFWVFV
jgi:putative flippase GtrA